MFPKIFFAQELKRLRANANISMQNLADAIGLKNKGTVSQFENGITGPASDTLIALSRYFNISIDSLLGHTPLLYHPDGMLEYRFLDMEGILQEGTFCYSFGVFPLPHLTSYFLYLEETKGDWISKILLSKGQFEFLALIGFLNDQLHLGYSLNKETNSVHRVNLVLQDNSESLNPLQRYKELKSGTACPVVLSEIFGGYENFIRDYLSWDTLHKKKFIANWLE